jgi:hypothetical protein
VNKSQPPQAGYQRGKVCIACGDFKLYAMFYADKKGRTHRHCKECAKAIARSQKARTPNRAVSGAKWRQANRLKTLIGAARYRANQKGLPFDLDTYRQYLEVRFDRGKCELTGIPFNVRIGDRRWDSPSLDRIYPEEGYVIENVRIVLYSINVMMNTWGSQIVLQVADAFRAKHYGSIMDQFEVAVRRRLGKFGSIECELTWKDCITASGQRLFRLVPSTRHTSENASGGSPNSATWVSPTAMDGSRGVAPPRPHDKGIPLSQQVGATAATWATVTAHDVRYAGYPESFETRNSERSQPLNEQAAHLPLGTGTNTTGSPARTASRGALNPEFTFWLMGLPQEFLAFAPAAMPSSRSWRRKS